MLLPENSPFGEDGILVFADCAVIPDPDAAQLAEIALSAADTARDIAGITPRIALLSFSTKGSAKHERVEKVIEGDKDASGIAPPNSLSMENFRPMPPLVPGVAKPESTRKRARRTCRRPDIPPLLRQAISPTNSYSAFAGVQAVGPILQGLAAPVNDLSRGCFPEDIYKTIIITCNQAIGAKHA